uniref:Titin n=1 Tax=Timema tahoe TaxID=61484 RepID=A0A7R9IEQ9_9NEOP|nr:unnamed protein product [Timema tahoe]
MIMHLEYDDDHVQEGHQYEYRIAAVNAAGPGKTSDTSAAISPKPMRAKYSITAKNDYGKDSADIEVIVVDKPGLPKGPLVYSNVTQDSVSLSWSPPLDDGGGDITGYVVEMSEFGSDSWRPVPGFCPKASFTAKGLHEGKCYVFRVRAENIYGLSEPLEGKPVVAKSPFDPPDAPSTPEITAYSPNNCSLTWNPPLNTGGKPITEEGMILVLPAVDLCCPPMLLAVDLCCPPMLLAVDLCCPPMLLAVDLCCLSMLLVAVPGVVGFLLVVARGLLLPELVVVVEVVLLYDVSQGYYVEKRERGGEWIKVNNYPTPNTSFTVQDLREGSRYEFRVIAINEAGPGKPSKPTDPIIAEAQRLKPDAPEPPKADRVTKDSVTLSWRTPRSDGGSKIKGYLIQKKKKGDSDWSDVNGTPVPDNVFKVPGLTEGEEYLFRVIAVNDVGPSDPSRPSNAIIIEEQPNKPCMDLGGMRDITVRAGEDFSIHVPYVAFPKPTLTWFNNDLLLDDKDARIFQQLSDDAASVVVKNSKRSDSGQYRLQLRNDAGFDTATINVRVLDRPGPPENLRADEFSGDALTLFWNPPKENGDPPGPPGAPRSIDSTEDSITISWTKPRHDGGSPITGYVVERRLISEDKWLKASHIHIIDLTYKVTSLIENHEYEFRVAAINAAGQGPWSSSSDTIVCRPPPCAPKITSDLSIRDMTVIAGEEFTITVPFIGNPQPKPTWTVNGEEIYPGDRIKFETNSNSTKFINRSAKRSDLGNYTIQLVNSEGSDTASCKVLVVDKPLPPQGPLEVSDITPETCSLSWRPPLDDGGSPITNYVVEKLDPSTGPNKKYTFRIRAENQYGLSDPLDLDQPITAKFAFTVPDPPGQPRIPDWDSSNITLTWDRPRNDGGSRIQGYKIEYRDVSEAEWRVANDYLVKDTTHIVHSLLQGQDYEFRVRAKNAAGFSKPSPPSSRFKLKSKSQVPSPPGTPKVVKVGRSYVDLQWEPPLSDGGSRITGYIIEKREVGSGTWQKCNDYNVLDCSYTVLNLIEQADYEFRIFAVNAAGKSEPSSCTTPVKICEIEGGEKPEFIRPLSNVGVPLGAPLVLECEARGKPTPSARWLKNGRELALGGRFYVESKGGVFKLNITEVWGVDDGDYMCEAINSLGYVTTSARLKIGTPPKIDRMPGDIYLPEGDNTKIKIYYSGDQPMEVTLSLPGPPIGPLDVSDVTKHTCTLNWKPPSYDGGLRITHYVVERRDISSTHWIIDQADCQSDTPSAPGVPKVTEIGGDFVNLQWDKPDSDGGARIQGYWIDKRESGSDAWQRANIALCLPTQFNISNLIEGRQYEFRVFAQNEAGLSPASTASTSVKIKDPLAAIPPEIVKPLRNANAIQNHNAEFQCTITGTPRPNITWYKGARELNHGNKYHMLKEGDTYSLVINDVYGEDADEYVCRAANKGGIKSTRAELVIMSK